jgi:hypothetical protein
MHNSFDDACKTAFRQPEISVFQYRTPSGDLESCRQADENPVYGSQPKPAQHSVKYSFMSGGEVWGASLLPAATSCLLLFLSSRSENAHHFLSGRFQLAEGVRLINCMIHSNYLYYSMVYQGNDI